MLTHYISRLFHIAIFANCHQRGRATRLVERCTHRMGQVFAALALMALAGVSLAQNCTYSIGATSANAPAAGGSGIVNVNATSGCAWTATASVSWLHVTSGANGSGDGSVNFSVDANSGGQRIGALTIAGLTFTVVQNAAVASTPLSLGPNASYTFNGGQVTLHVDSVRNNRSAMSGSMRL